MTHPLVARLAPLMDRDLDALRAIVAEWVLECPSEQERAVLRYFGAELGAVQRRIRCRRQPPTEEEVEIALAAVWALMARRARPEAPHAVPPQLHALAADDSSAEQPCPSSQVCSPSQGSTPLASSRQARSSVHRAAQPAPAAFLSAEPMQGADSEDGGSAPSDASGARAGRRWLLS
jgi:hypothetical protein